MTNLPEFSLRSSRALLSLALASIVFVSACGSKKTPIPPPPPPGPSASGGGSSTPVAGRPAIASFAVEPSTVARGQSAVLRWSVTGSTTNIAIDHGLGTVPAMGTLSVQPFDTTTYTLTASNFNGDTSATTTLTVTVPPPPPASTIPTEPSTRRGTLESRVQSDLQDALFDYDSNNIREDARVALTNDAAALKRIFSDFPSAVVIVEGHCDERGSAEYNLALGDRRASAARDFLQQLGVPADHLKTISYGKERPACTEADEACYQTNRRAHFSANQ